MIPVLIKTASSSVFVGIGAAVCLRAAAIGNVFAQKASLGFVLVGALATPLLIQIMERLRFQPTSTSIVRPSYPMTLLQELQEILQARSGSGGPLPVHFLAPVQTPDSPQPERSSRPASGPASAPGAQEPRPSSTEPASAPDDASSNPQKR